MQETDSIKKKNATKYTRLGGLIGDLQKQNKLVGQRILSGILDTIEKWENHKLSLTAICQSRRKKRYLAKKYRDINVGSSENYN